MKNKYGNKKIDVHGITFDSKAEAIRYIELKELVAVGDILNLQLQPRFELQPAFKKHNRSYRKIEYIADFYYEDHKGNKYVEDVKGYCTDVFLLKQKMFEYQYPKLTLRLVKRGK